MLDDEPRQKQIDILAKRIAAAEDTCNDELRCKTWGKVAGLGLVHEVNVALGRVKP